MAVSDKSSVSVYTQDGTQCQKGFSMGIVEIATEWRATLGKLNEEITVIVKAANEQHPPLPYFALQGEYMAYQVAERALATWNGIDEEDGLDLLPIVDYDVREIILRQPSDPTDPFGQAYVRTLQEIQAQIRQLMQMSGPRSPFSR
ncbi:MAG: hypothetical protein ACREJM_01960 [Candidatus Saccharimonadales bacterium]